MRFFWQKNKKAESLPEPVVQPTAVMVVTPRRTSYKAEPQSNPSILDHLLALSPTEFEHAIARLLPRLGYSNVKRIGGAGDLGVDIICYDKGGNFVVVQCKRYARGKNITGPSMQTFFGMVLHHDARHGIYVTTSTFTKSAFDLASSCRFGNIRAIDGAGVVDLFSRYPDALNLGQPWVQPEGRTFYDRNCRYCGRQIQMRVLPDGRWLPFEGLEQLHDCRS